MDPGLGGPTPAVIHVKKGCHIMKQTSSTNVICGCMACISTLLNEITTLDVLKFKLIWTASIKPRLLFSLAGYASWGLSLSSVYYITFRLHLLPIKCMENKSKWNAYSYPLEYIACSSNIVWNRSNRVFLYTICIEIHKQVLDYIYHDNRYDFFKGIVYFYKP